MSAKAGTDDEGRTALGELDLNTPLFKRVTNNLHKKMKSIERKLSKGRGDYKGDRPKITKRNKEQPNGESGAVKLEVIVEPPGENVQERAIDVPTGFGILPDLSEQMQSCCIKETESEGTDSRSGSTRSLKKRLSSGSVSKSNMDVAFCSTVEPRPPLTSGLEMEVEIDDVFVTPMREPPQKALSPGSKRHTASDNSGLARKKIVISPIINKSVETTASIQPIPVSLSPLVGRCLLGPMAAQTTIAVSSPTESATAPSSATKRKTPDSVLSASITTRKSGKSPSPEAEILPDLFDDLHDQFEDEGRQISPPKARKKAGKKGRRRSSAAQDLIGIEEFSQLDLDKEGSAKKERNRRRSADHCITEQQLELLPSPESAETDAAPFLIPPRRSSRIKRKSIELYRESLNRSQISAIKDEEEKEEEEEIELEIDIDNNSFLDSTIQQTTSPFSCTDDVISFSPIESVRSSIIDEDRLLENRGSTSSVEESINDDRNSVNINETSNVYIVDCGASCDDVTSAVDQPRRSKRTRCSNPQPEVQEAPKMAARRKGVKKAKRRVEPAIEDIYCNKLWRSQMPQQRRWETIFESPRPVSRYQSARGKLCILDQNDFYSQQRLRKRRLKAGKQGWKPLTKRREEAVKRILDDRLYQLQQDLHELEERTEEDGIKEGDSVWDQQHMTLALDTLQPVKTLEPQPETEIFFTPALQPEDIVEQRVESCRARRVVLPSTSPPPEVDLKTSHNSGAFFEEDMDMSGVFTQLVDNACESFAV